MRISEKDKFRAALVGISQSTLKERLKKGWDLEKAVTYPKFARQDKELDEIITPEQYAQAEANGIDHNRLWRRVNESGWDMERAITEPVNKRGKYKRDSKYGDYAKIAEHNGIPFKTFWARVNTNGWELEKAASVPVRKKD